MNNLFQRASSHWVKYSEYEIKTTADGTRYIKPVLKAKPVVYDPLKDAENLVVDALNVGLLQMGRAEEKVVIWAISLVISSAVKWMNCKSGHCS